MTSQQPSGIVTPEAVLLEFETAGVGSRTVAELLDVCIQIGSLLAVAMAVSFIAGTTGGSLGGTFAVIAFLVLVFLVIIGYPVAMESLWNGRTPGKAALGLRVVTVEGGPVRFRHAAVRGIFGLFELWITFGSVAVLSVILTRRDQRLGDLAAGTLVLRERTVRGATMAVAFPAPFGYESYVASLDVSALTPDQYGVIRTFLVRVLDLTVAARAALAVKLANHAATQVRHTPPPGLPPELFLACVAAAYQVRHGGPLPSPPAAPWGPPVAGSSTPPPVGTWSAPLPPPGPGTGVPPPPAPPAGGGATPPPPWAPPVPVPPPAVPPGWGPPTGQ